MSTIQIRIKDGEKLNAIEKIKAARRALIHLEKKLKKNEEIPSGGFMLHTDEATNTNASVRVSGNHENVVHSLIKNLSRERIIEMARRDEEKPMGALLTYIRDMYGLTKTDGWDVAFAVLNHFKVENKMY